MDTKQDWRGLDGAIAWHLIERQAENWNQVGEMMNEWLKANTPTKEWVGLTESERNDVVWSNTRADDIKEAYDVAVAIEQALREKNK